LKFVYLIKYIKNFILDNTIWIDILYINQKVKERENKIIRIVMCWHCRGIFIVSLLRSIVYTLHIASLRTDKLFMQTFKLRNGSLLKVFAFKHLVSWKRLLLSRWCCL